MKLDCAGNRQLQDLLVIAGCLMRSYGAKRYFMIHKI